MKLNIITLALAATAFGALAANAQTTIIEERRPPAVVIEQEPPASSSVTVQERGGFLGTEKKTTNRNHGHRSGRRLFDAHRAQGRSGRREDRQQDRLSVSVCSDA